VVATVALVLGLVIGGSGKSSPAKSTTSTTTEAAQAPTTTRLTANSGGARTGSTALTTRTTPTTAPKTLLSTGGQGIQTTASFTVPGGNWDLRWHYDCKAGSPGTFEVFAYKGSALAGEVVKEVGPSGTSVDPLHDGPGSFYLHVNTACAWNVVVVTG